MIAFTNETVPAISASLDFFNVMAYDLMNRRDTVTRHHTSLLHSLDSVNAYLEKDVEPEKINLGLAYYVKWFRTTHDPRCLEKPTGCPTVLLEDPVTGADLGQAGAFSWHDRVPSELAASFERAKLGGEYDHFQGGYSFWDAEEDIFWSWDTPKSIRKKFPAIVDEKQLGGVFAWGLGEDAPDFAHLDATVDGLQKYTAVNPQGREKGKDEL